MRSKSYFSITSASLALALLLAVPALAQEQETAAATDSAVTTISTEAVQDTTVTEVDLDASTPGPFNFLKRAARSVQQVVTFNPVKKAELNLKTAHEELLRAQKIIKDNPGDAANAAKVEKALAKFQANVAKVKERATAIKGANAEQAQAFLKKIANLQVKQQKMLDNIESDLPADGFTAVNDAREAALASGASAMLEIATDSTQLGEVLDTAMAEQTGSDFKEFKNLEVLGRLAKLVPEQAREAISQARDRAEQRFEQRMNQITPEERAAKFENYIGDLNGNSLEQVKVLDDMKGQNNLPTDFFQHVEGAKARAIGKFEVKLRDATSPESQNSLVEQAADGDLAGLRVLQQVKDNIPADLKEKIQAKQTEAINKFKEQFSGDPNAQDSANKFQVLSQQMRDNPDSTAFALIQDLQKNLPPAQQAFVTNLRQQATQGAVEQFQQDPQKFLQKSQSINPTAVQDIQGIVGQAPQLQGIFQQVASQQTNFTKQQIENTTDPARFEALQEKLNNNPSVNQQIQTRFGNFQQDLREKAAEIQEIKNQPAPQNNLEARQRVEQQVQQRQENIQQNQGQPKPEAGNAGDQLNRPNTPVKAVPPENRGLEQKPQPNIQNQQPLNKPLLDNRPAAEAREQIQQPIKQEIQQRVEQKPLEVRPIQNTERPQGNLNQGVNNQPQNLNQAQPRPQGAVNAPFQGGGNPGGGSAGPGPSGPAGAPPVGAPKPQ